MRTSTILASLIAVLVAGCGAAPQMPHMPPPEVGAAKPVVRPLPVQRELTGRIEAVEVIDIRPQISGEVTRVLVRDGADVKAGDMILEIDPAPKQALVAQAEANVGQAEAQLRLAISTRDRNAKLFKEQVVAQQVYDDSVLTAQVAEAAVAAARAAVTTARLDLGYATVKAPIGGRIGKVLATPGNLVQGAGMVQGTLLATLVSTDPVYVSFDLDETTYHRIAGRLSAGNRSAQPVPVRIGLAGEEGHPHAGTVVFVDNQIDAGSGSIHMRALVPDPAHLLTPGSFARVSLEVEPPRPVVLVHEQAILAQLATRYVLTIDASGVTAFRPVALGPMHGALREVVQGLGPDDLVAVTNLAKVFFPGMPVAPTPVDMETLAAPAGAASAASAAPAAPAGH